MVMDSLEIQISASAKEASAQIDNLIKKMGVLQKNIAGTTAKNSSVNNFASKMGLFLRQMNNTKGTKKNAKAFSSMTASITRAYYRLQAINKTVESIANITKETADYLEAYNYFEVAFGKVGSDWAHEFEKYGYESAEAYSNSFKERMDEVFQKLSGVSIKVDAEGNGLLTETGMKNLGLNIREVTQYAAQLASVTNSVGQAGEVSFTAASALTKLSADLSSLSNRDFSKVMNDMQSGLIGQARALYKYGIDITNATLQTYAYELGIEKAVSEMTQAEKMQLRMIAILEQSKVAWGDLANTINSPSNMMRQFGNNVKEVGIVLGQLFVPLIQKVMPFLNGLAIALKRFLQSAAEFLGIKLDLGSFGQGYSDLETDIGGVSDGFEEATKEVKKFKGQLQSFDELNVISSGNALESGTGNAIDLAQQILASAAEYEKAWREAFEKMENESIAWADRIISLFTEGKFFQLGETIGNSITKALSKIDWQSVYEVAGQFGDGLAQFLNGLISPELFGEVGKTIASALNTGIYTALSFAESFDFYGFGQSIASGINSFFDTYDFASLADSLNKWVNGLKDFIAGFLKTIDISKIFGSVGEFLGNLEADTLTIAISAIAFKYLGSIITKATFAELLMKKTSLGSAGVSIPLNLKIILGAIAIAGVADIGFKVGEQIGKFLFPEDAEWYEYTLTEFVQEFINIINSAEGKNIFEKLGNTMWDAIKGAFEESTDEEKAEIQLKNARAKMGIDEEEFQKYGLEAVDNFNIGFKTSLEKNTVDINGQVSNYLTGDSGTIVGQNYGAGIVSGMNKGINGGTSTTTSAINTYMNSINKNIHDSVLQFGSPSKKTEAYGKDTILGFNNGITKNQKQTYAVVRAYMNSIANTFKQNTSQFVEIGKIVGTNINKGLQEEMDKISEQLQKTVDKLKEDLNKKQEDGKNTANKPENTVKSIAPTTSSVASYVSSYAPKTYDNAQTNALLVQLIDAVNNKDMSVELDGRKISKSVQRQDTLERTRTGKGLFEKGGVPI